MKTGLMALAMGLLPVAAWADTADQILAQAKADCASVDNGVFAAGPGAVVSTDVTGDGTPDTVVDSKGFTCSTAASFWSGSGGDQFWVVVGDRDWSFQAHAWEVIDWQGQRILMQWLHGGVCGGYGAQKCVGALVWDDTAGDGQKGEFMSIANAAQ